jgi:hypothetical protein
MVEIEIMTKWKIIEKILLEKKYTLFQMQYGVDEVEGFQATFIHKENDYKVKTYNKEISKEIIDYNKKYEKLYNKL